MRSSMNQAWRGLIQIRVIVIQIRLLRSGRGHAAGAYPAPSRSGLREPRLFSSEHAKGPPRRPFWFLIGGGKFFFTPYYQNTKSGELEGQLSLGLLAGKLCGMRD